jgi:hypothetical protein
MAGFLGKYYAGIWEATLPGSLLLWSDTRDVACIGRGVETHTRPKLPSAPTWSWISVEGLVSTWGRNCRTVVSIRAIRYQPVNEEPYGRCLEGVISILGELRSVKLLKLLRNSFPHIPGYIHEIWLAGQSESVGYIMPDTNAFDGYLELIFRAYVFW